MILLLSPDGWTRFTSVRIQSSDDQGGRVVITQSTTQNRDFPVRCTSLSVFQFIIRQRQKKQVRMIPKRSLMLDECVRVTFTARVRLLIQGVTTGPMLFANRCLLTQCKAALEIRAVV